MTCSTILCDRALWVLRREGLSGIACLLLLFSALPAKAFTLSAPKPGAIVASGERLPVSVEAGNNVNLRGLKFYWYRSDQEPIASNQADPAAYSQTDGAAPFTGFVTVPADGIGVMRLLAVGEVTRGRLGGHEDFDEVLLMVRPMTGPGTESEFWSSDEGVISVDPEGMAKVKGNGKATVTVKNRGKEGRLTVLVEAEMNLNHEPVARVPAELTVKSGHLVVLDGLQSRDPDGDPLHYEWKQLRGNKVPLLNSNEAKATFMAPPVVQRRQLQFSLQVTDMAGPDTVKGADSRPAIISVWVDP